MKRPVPASFLTMPQAKKIQHQPCIPSTSSNGSTMPSKVREVQFDNEVVLSSTSTSSSNHATGANKASHQRGK
jgi:hypothetical protein